MGRPFILDRRQPTARGLIGLWGPGSPSGTTWFDHAGRGYHGTLTGMDPATDWVVDSERGWVIDSDGVDTKKVVVSHNSSLNLSDGNFTIAFWSQPDVLSSFNTLIDKVSASAGYAIWTTADGKWRYTRNGYGSGLGPSTNAMTVGQWDHWAVTDRSGATQWYFNGTAELGGDVSNPTADTTDLWFTTAQTNDAFNGRVADIRIYNRPLSAAEMNHIYRSTLREPYGDLLLQPRRIFKAPVAPTGAIMNQMQGANLGADLFDGTLLV